MKRLREWRWRVGIVLVFALLWILATPVLASNGEGDIPSFDVWLLAASGPLVSIIVGFLLSFAIEWWSGYDQLSPKQKRLAYFALCLLVPVAAACARAALGYVPWSFDPLIWHAMWNGFGAGGVGTMTHTRKL